MYFKLSSLSHVKIRNFYKGNLVVSYIKHSKISTTKNTFIYLPDGK